MTTTAQLIAAEAKLRKDADAALDARVSKLEAAAGAVPVPPLSSPAPTPGSALTSAPTPSTPAPAIGGSVIEGGVRATRVSALRHDYATRPAWNADGSRILVRTVNVAGGIVDPAHLLDGKTGADLGSFALYSGGFWSSKDPDKLYAVSGNSIVRQYLTAPTPIIIATLPFTPIIGGFEGATPDDDSLMAIVGGGQLLTLNPLTGQIIGSITWSGDNAKPSHSGKYVVLVGSSIIVMNRDLTGARVIAGAGTFGGPHGDCATDVDGSEWFVMNNATGVRAFRLSDGTQRQLLPPGTAFEYGHVSGRGEPGTVILSNHNTPATKGRPGCDQIVALRLDGSGLVEPFGWAHHGGESPYASQPHAVQSPDGRVLFASEWAGTVSSYVAEQVA